MAFRNVDISKVLTIALLILTTPMSDAFMANGGFYRKKNSFPGGNLFFSGTDSGGINQLWMSDGTAYGTVKIVPSSGAASTGVNPQVFAQAGKRIVFLGATPSLIGALWTTDGTSGGTVPITQSILSTTASATTNQVNPNFVTVGSNVFFYQVDTGGAPQLFVTDGVPSGAGTKIVPIPLKSTTITPGSLTAFGSSLFFYDQDTSGAAHMYKTDGTTTTVVTLTGVAAGATVQANSPWGVANGLLYFAAIDATGVAAEFSYDGMSTFQEFKVANTTGFGFKWPIYCNGFVYFTGLNVFPRYNIYQLNPSTGTSIAYDLSSINYLTSPRSGLRATDLVCYKNNVYFANPNSTQPTPYGILTLQNGVVSVVTSTAGGTPSSIIQSVGPMAVKNSTLYFLAGTVGATSTGKLWSTTDGSAANTNLISIPQVTSIFENVLFLSQP